MTYDIHPIAPDVLSLVRQHASNLPVEHLVAGGGEPLRCCLRDAREGESCLLMGYEPPLPESPYAEKGAVFVHAEPCAGPEAAGYPETWRGRPQVLRAYDARGWIHAATRVHDGTDPEGVIAEILEDPDVVRIHSRNIGYGCYMFEITHAG